MEKKICTKCKEEKTLDLFFKRKQDSKIYPTSSCKKCRNKYTTEKRKKDPLKEKLRRIKKLYKLPGEKYLQMLKDQKNTCKICKRETDLEVDHCHESLKVRGLLCTQCNVGLGSFFDNPDFLREAVNYLENKDS